MARQNKQVNAVYRGLINHFSSLAQERALDNWSILEIVTEIKDLWLNTLTEDESRRVAAPKAAKGKTKHVREIETETSVTQ